MEPVGTLVGHRARVWQVDWHPSGAVLASCSEDKTIRLWKLVESEWVCFVLPTQTTLSDKHTKSVRAVSWSRSGAYLASASFDGTVIIWAYRPPLLEGVLTLEGHESEVKSVGWSLDDRFLATCGRDKTVWIWQTDVDLEYETVAVLSKHTQDVKMILWHPSHLLLASASYDNTVIIWETNESEDWISKDILTGHESTVWCKVHIGVDWVGEDLISCGADLTLRHWQATPRGNKSYAQCGADDQIVIYRPSESSIAVVDRIPSAHRADINCVRACGELVASCSDDKAITLWRLRRD